VGRGLGVGTNLGVGVCLGVALGVVVAVAVGVGVTVGLALGVGVGVPLDRMVRTTSFVSYVTSAVTPAGAVIVTFENVVLFSPPLASNKVYCIPTIKGPPLSVTFNWPSSPAVPPTITLPARSGITVADMIAAESKVRSPLIEIIVSGVRVP
jgi:hypothetical protein